MNANGSSVAMPIATISVSGRDQTSAAGVAAGWATASAGVTKA
jgi:hypothetical protein